jgi:predicted secreted hydrolase
VARERAARANLGASLLQRRPRCLDRRLADAPAAARSRRGLALQMQSPQFSWDLTLTPSQPLLLQGDNGYSRKGHGPELASYYVSWPQLQVAGGTLLRDGRRQAVSGRAWFDHEWSTTLLGDRAVGWDWLGINLADGGALMAFRMRDAAGETLFAHAAWRDAAGRLRQFAPARSASRRGATGRRHAAAPTIRCSSKSAAASRRCARNRYSTTRNCRPVSGAGGLLGRAGQGRGQPQRSRLPGNDRLCRAAV